MNYPMSKAISHVRQVAQVMALRSLMLLAMCVPLVVSVESPVLQVYDHTPRMLLPSSTACSWYNIVQTFSPSTGALISSSGVVLGAANSPPNYYWQGDAMHAGTAQMNAAFTGDGGVYLLDREGMRIWRNDGASWPINASSLSRTAGWSWGYSTGNYGTYSTAYGNGSVYATVTNNNVTRMIRFILGAPGTITSEVATTISFGTNMVTESFGGMAFGDGALWLYERIGDGKLTPRLWRIDPTTMVASPRSVSFNGSPSGAWPYGNGLAYHNGTLHLLDVTRILKFSANGGNYTGHYSLPWTTNLHVSGGINLGYRGVGMGFAVPLPVVTMTAPDASGAEGGANGMTLQFNRTGTSGDLLVNYYITPWDGDLTVVGGTSFVVTIPNGASSMTVNLSVTDDSLNEGIETFVAVLDPMPRIPAYVVGSPSSATLTVTDNDTIPTVNITASDSSATEGGDTATYTISVTPAHPTNLVVQLKPPTGTATSGSDYSALPTSVTIPANTASYVVTVSPINDTAYESTETVILAFEGNAAYVIGASSSATVSIIDNDKPTVTITASDASATEGGDSAAVTISRGSAINTPLTVKISPPTGTAVSASDYTALPTSVTIPANASTVVLTIVPINDTTAELPETVIIALVSDPAYNIGSPSSATITIFDNETPVISITASDANGKEGGTDNGRFTLTRLGLRSAALPVNLTRAGSATASSDYTAIAASVTIGANTNTLDVAVTVLDDTTTETDETVAVTVATGTGYIVGSPSVATVTIADNETPRLIIAATDATAAEQGLSTGTFTITRDGNKSPALTVNLGFLKSTAVNGTDFDTIAGTLAMAANVTSATITVKPKDDTAMEPSETVVCTLSSGTGYVLGTSFEATVTITDNDTQTVTIHATSGSAAEPATNGAFVVRRVGPTTAALTVTYTIATGTGRATNGSDFNTIPLTATIAAGATESPSIPITVINDANYEGPETVQLTISSSTLYVIGSQPVATVTIADNDKPTVTVSLVDGNAAEPSDTGKFRLTRSGILTIGSLTVKYQMSGRAINGTDYSLLSGTATIAQNSASVDVTLTPLPDELIEGIETAILTITTDAAYNVGSPSVATVSIGSSVIDTVAGKGPAFYTSTPTMGGQATATGLGTPTGVAVDASGNRYVVDGDANAVLKITAAGVISRFAGNASWGAGFAGDGGQATAASLSSPQGVAVDTAGNVYIADTSNNRIRKVVASTGIITTVAGAGPSRFGGDGGPATAAWLKTPSAVSLDGSGNIYIADTGNQRIRKVTVSTGIITTVAGNGSVGFGGDGGQAAAAQVSSPKSIDVDASGNIYIADTGNNRVRKVTVSTGIITTIAGNGTAGFAGDGGSPTAAQLSGPEGVAISNSGEVFLSDTGNNRVRKIEGSVIVTVGGNGQANYTGDGGAATNAALYYPVGLAFDVTGNLFVADAYNASIRRLKAGISAIAKRGEADADMVLLAWLNPQHSRSGRGIEE